MNVRLALFIVCLLTLSVLVLGGFALAAPRGDTPPDIIARGGQLYDSWVKAAGVAQPDGDQMLWSTQTTNTRAGKDTWRCKECHGWDYKGKDGAYGSGSHRTGFVGVVDASKSKTVDEIADVLRGAQNPDHDFSSFLDDESIGALASFVKEGVIEDLAEYIDYPTKQPKSADAARGEGLFAVCASCHGSDGTALNFGSADDPEYVGTIAVDNPQEFLHKARMGQPGTSMPSGVQMGWSLQDVLDVLAYAQTLPTSRPAAEAAPTGDTPPDVIAQGGQLYDSWVKAAGVAQPDGDQMLWSTQTTNTRAGKDTWRCKECHGWDYKGKDGAYGSGSHRTGFVGVVEASKSRTVDEIVDVLKGAQSPDHDFSSLLDDASISALAGFVKDGVIEDMAEYIDYPTKRPKSADAARGEGLFAVCASCHGSDGTALNFGSDSAPEYVGTVAADNPQEFLHKARMGQPGTSMPAGVQMGLSMEDILDILAHAQTLPTGN